MRRSIHVISCHVLNAPTPRVLPTLPTFRSRPAVLGFSAARHFSLSSRFQDGNAQAKKQQYENQAKELNRQGQKDQEHSVKSEIEQGKLEEAIGNSKELQARTPWHREGSDAPPVKRNRSASAMTKGKLLTTPSRLLKLILPLTTDDKNSDRKDIEPLALLVHPNQPLSYLERLIQSELPMLEDKSGRERSPEVYFRAEDSGSDDQIGRPKHDEEEGTDEQMIDGKIVKVGKIEKKNKDEPDKLESLETDLRGGPGEGGVETYSGQGHDAPTPEEEVKFVRWSSSTEIGDFIRDAARGREFAVEIEGAMNEIRVGVPSFNDRTHYLRVRLRKTSARLATMATLKKECDTLAHKSAQRLAMGGFGILLAWWGATYYLTFQTSYGWDTMEPVTYLAGLSTIMCGYLWFLYHNREVSYRSALNITVSRRQNTLYEKKGFDLQKWESLIDEANALRKEIKGVANEYDVEWDEKKDEGSEEVHDALREERKKAKKRLKKEEDDHDDDDDDKKSSKKDKKDD